MKQIQIFVLIHRQPKLPIELSSLVDVQTSYSYVKSLGRETLEGITEESGLASYGTAGR